MNHSLIVVLCLVVGALGHAVLVNPTPFNTNPTTLSPCGTSSMPSAVPQVTWVAGSTQQIVWRLVAGDGGNSVTIKIDPQGGTNFSETILANYLIGTTLTKYNINFTLPATLLGCPNGVCTLQAKSNLNWVSCAYVNITCNDCPVPSPAPPTCKLMPSLSFCSDKNNKNVSLAADTTGSILDEQTRDAYSNTIKNPNVFANNGTECQTKYKNFLCDINFPPCPSTGGILPNGTACQALCRDAMNACMVTEKHANLYDCDSYPPCNENTITTTTTTTTTSATTSSPSATTDSTASSNANRLFVFPVALLLCFIVTI